MTGAYDGHDGLEDQDCFTMFRVDWIIGIAASWVLVDSKSTCSLHSVGHTDANLMYTGSCFLLKKAADNPFRHPREAAVAAKPPVMCHVRTSGRVQRVMLRYCTCSHSVWDKGHGAHSSAGGQ